MTGVLITGVSRTKSIGYNIAKRFNENGFKVYVHGSKDYDKMSNYNDVEIKFQESNFISLGDGDLFNENEINALCAKIKTLNNINHLIINHAYSTFEPIEEWSIQTIQKHMQVNITATMMIIQAFINQFDGNDGRITIMTSGQHMGPMVDEMAYAVSKGALVSLMEQLNYLCHDKGINVNAINPGPTDTGYIDIESELYKEIANMFMHKRWGSTEDAVNLIEFLHSEKGKWITGQLINSEGGFNRFK